MDNTLNVIGIGELLWDMLPGGKKLGGAPCNFVYHAQKQGAEAFTVSAVGNDNNGIEILQLLKLNGISSEFIQVNDKPTGTVDVELNDEGIPQYTIHENVAWDYVKLDENTKKAFSNADIICFGSLAQRNIVSGSTIENLLTKSKSSALIVFDINLRQKFYSREVIEKSLQLCNVLKLNEDELPVVCDLLGIAAESEKDQITYLIKKYNLKLVAFTKGAEGSLLMTANEISYMKTPKVTVKDTVGAGDSFTAVMIINFAGGNSLKELHQKAVEVSAFVCTQDGAMPEYN
jgi:fructokinase